MARRTFLKLTAVCLISTTVPSAFALSAALRAAEDVGLLPRAGTGCADSSLTACNKPGLPSDFCCPSGDSCYVFNSGNSVICCPPGKDCSSISTISCDVGLQNVTAHPTSPLFTTQLQTQMTQCNGQCCPVGMFCNGQDCSVNATSSSSSSSSSSTAGPSSSATSTSPSSQSAAVTSSSASSSPTSDNSTAVAAAAASARCNQFPNTAILVGFFSGLVAGIILAVLLICCFGRTTNRNKDRPHSDFSNLTANVSDPIYQGGSGRTDFLRRESNSKAMNPTERVKSFFRTPTMRSRQGSEGNLVRSGTTMTGKSGTSTAPPKTPKTPSTLRHQASGESITIYSPPNLHGPGNMPPLPMTERNTTVGSMMERADGRSEKTADSPPNANFERMLAEVGWKTGQPFLGSPGMVDPRSRRIGDV